MEQVNAAGIDAIINEVGRRTREEKGQFTVSDEDDSTDVDSSIDQNEETIQSSEQGEIDIPVDTKRADDYQANCHSQGLGECKSGQPGFTAVSETESEFDGHSSSLTSSTTTAGTFTLPMQSPETEDEVGRRTPEEKGQRTVNEEDDSTDVDSSIDQNEETIQLSDQGEIDIPVESKHADDYNDYSHSQGECKSGQPGFTAVSASLETESEFDGHSSSLTSSTSTAGTFTLHMQSPETEDDQRETFLEDEEPTLLPDHLVRFQWPQSSQVLGFSQIPSDVFFGIEAAQIDGELVPHPLKDVSVAQSLKSNKATSIPSTTSNSETNDVAESSGGTWQDMEAEGVKVDMPESAVPTNRSEMNKCGEVEITSAPGTSAVELPSKAAWACETSTIVNDGENRSEESEGKTTTPANLEFGESLMLDTCHIGAVTSTLSISHVPFSSNPQIEQDSTDEKSDAIVTTDDDEYSGYDIDIEDLLSCQGEQRLAEEDIPVICKSSDNPKIGLACDSENIPLFADVRYSIGEQVECIPTKTCCDADETPTEDRRRSENTTVLPWHFYEMPGEEDNASSKNVSFPSDDTENSRKISYDFRNVNEEISIRVAAETVSSAIKEAYKLACGDTKEVLVYCDFEGVTKLDNVMGANEQVDTSVSGYKNSSPVGESAEIDAVFADAALEIQGESAIEISPTQLVETRENITLGGEKISVKSTSVEQGSTSTIASKGAVAGRHVRRACVPQSAVSVALKKGFMEDDSESHGILVAPLIDKLVENSEDMGKASQSADKPGNFRGKMTYNPALSQRNTEATKWFGQPTSRDKIRMKSLGKVDESAEIERRKVIKAMTRRHNPNIAPKWQPSQERDYTEDLDEKQKESLKKYEERRRRRSGGCGRSESEAKVPVASSIAEMHCEPLRPSSELLSENIIIDSVVHSRDAISAWECRLSEKHLKEELERRRLSSGKQRRTRERATLDVSRTRTDSASSVGSNASTTLPTSEHIERDSMDVSKIRNRWRNIEEQSNKERPVLLAKKESSRRSNFSVNAVPAYRSYQSPSPVAQHSRNVPPVNSRRTEQTVRSSSQKESFIDREIREAAEREERWKHEQLEKMSEVSVSSEEAFSLVNPLASPINPRVAAAVNTCHLPTPNSINFDGENWKSEQNFTKTGSDWKLRRSKDISGNGCDIVHPVDLPRQHENASYKIHSASLSSSDSSGPGGSGLVSPLRALQDKSKESTKKQRVVAYLDIGPSTFASEHGENDLVETDPSCDTGKDAMHEESALIGFCQHMKCSKTKDVSEYPNGRKDDVSKITHSKPAPISSSLARRIMEGDTSPRYNSTKSISSPAEKNATTLEAKEGVKKSNSLIKKKASRVEVSSGKSRLQALMEKEMLDASAREEEWRRKQQDLVNQGIDITPHHVVHSTREIRTPTGAIPRPTVNAAQSEVQLRPAKSSFVGDKDVVHLSQIPDEESDFENRAVVRAMRVPKRKSQLAMMWENGQFPNNFPSENE